MVTTAALVENIRDAESIGGYTTVDGHVHAVRSPRRPCCENPNPIRFTVCLPPDINLNGGVEWFTLESGVKQASGSFGTRERRNTAPEKFQAVGQAGIESGCMNICA